MCVESDRLAQLSVACRVVQECLRKEKVPRGRGPSPWAEARDRDVEYCMYSKYIHVFDQAQLSSL